MIKKSTGSTNAALNLIQYQQDTVRVTKLTQPLHALRWHRTNTALPLDGLDNDGRSLVGHSRLQSLMISEGHMIKAGQ